MAEHHENWGGARENCGRRAVYRGKAFSPCNVRLTHVAHARLLALRNFCDLSIGDMIETLIWDLPVESFEKRPPQDLKRRRVSFRLSIAGLARFKQLLREYDVSGGDVVEALIRNTSNSYAFPSKRRAA